MQCVLCYWLGVSNFDVVLSLGTFTILAGTSYVFNGGENCPSIGTYHNICVVKGLDDHAFLACTTCKLYAGEKCMITRTVHSIEIVWEVPILKYGARARFARH